MTDYIGHKQRELLDALRSGAALYQEKGWWYFDGRDVQFQSRRRCMALYTRGFLMAEQDGTRTRYVLTDLGRRA